MIDDVIEYDAPWVKQRCADDALADLAMQRRASRRAQLRCRRDLHASTARARCRPRCCAISPASRCGSRIAARTRMALLTDWVREPEPQHGTRHEVERQLASGRASRRARADTRMRFDVRPPMPRRSRHSCARAASIAMRRSSSLHPGATAASRRYPTERFGASRRTSRARNCDAPMLVTGAPQRKRAMPRKRAGDGARGASISSARCRSANWPRSSSARACSLSNNSGPVHLASALGTPVVDLYALTNPQHTPWQTPHRVLYRDVPCRWCYRSVCPEGHHACLRSASACDEVVGRGA